MAPEMKKPRRVFWVILLSAATTSCLTPAPMTRIQTVVKDPQFTPTRFQRALIIGVFPDIERRTLFENEFANELKKYGEETLTSYSFIPSITGMDRSKVEALVKEQKIDIVFITRLVEKKTVQTTVAAHTQEVPASPLDGAVTYFDSGRKEVTQPGYTVDQTVAVLETKVFESQTGSCVWTCRSDTLVNGYLDDLMRSFAKVMAESLYAPVAKP
jgi:hypothetical protein